MGDFEHFVGDLEHSTVNFTLQKQKIHLQIFMGGLQHLMKTL